MQTINRNNYEEFFLLYVDDELNAAEKHAVENFVLQNPDLTVEFKMLLQTKSVADETVFFDKENLLRTEGNSINENNYQEYFLLYIDNELSTAKREEVEMYVLQHPKLQDEFTTLKACIFSAETISFGDKESLYRTEKRRTIFIKPWRLAAAAIFIGVCAVVFWLMQKPAAIHSVADHAAQHQIKQNIAAIKPVNSIQQNKKPQPEIIKQPEQIVAQQSSSTKKENNHLTKTTFVKIKKEESGNDNATKIIKDEAPQIVIQHPDAEHNNDVAKTLKEPPAETDVLVAPKTNQQNTVAQTPVKNNNQYNVYPVAYKELNTNDDNNSLHVAMLDLNKNKVKTLFKKASRIFGNKSNDLANEDGKLQIANFEIDTKKQ